MAQPREVAIALVGMQKLSRSTVNGVSLAIAAVLLMGWRLFSLAVPIDVLGGFASGAVIGAALIFPRIKPQT